MRERSLDPSSSPPATRSLLFGKVVPVAVLALCLATACTKSSSPTNEATAAGGSVPTSAATGTTGSGADVGSGGTIGGATGTTARGGSTGSTRSTSGSGGGGAISTSGPCAALTKEQIESATGLPVTRTSTVRGGCYWENGTTPVVQLDVEKPSGDAAKAWASEKQLYGGTGDGPGVGEDSFYSFDTEVYWLQSGTIYHMRVTGVTPNDKEKQVTTDLAGLASSQLS